MNKYIYIYITHIYIYKEKENNKEKNVVSKSPSKALDKANYTKRYFLNNNVYMDVFLIVYPILVF